MDRGVLHFCVAGEFLSLVAMYLVRLRRAWISYAGLHPGVLIGKWALELNIISCDHDHGGIH